MFFNLLQTPDIRVDLLADSVNKMCPRYYSRYRDGYSLGCNWMNTSYYAFQSEIAYLNPPFRGDYLELSISHIVMKRINTYIILPVWPSAPWYSKVMAYASRIIELPQGYKYFSSPSYMTTRATKNWRLIFVYFSFSRYISKKYYSFDLLTQSLVLLDKY